MHSYQMSIHYFAEFFEGCTDHFVNYITHVAHFAVSLTDQTISPFTLVRRFLSTTNTLCNFPVSKLRHFRSNVSTKEAFQAFLRFRRITSSNICSCGEERAVGRQQFPIFFHSLCIPPTTQQNLLFVFSSLFHTVQVCKSAGFRPVYAYPPLPFIFSPFTCTELGCFRFCIVVYGTGMERHKILCCVLPTVHF